MDKLSYKILMYISRQEKVNREELISVFGNDASASINFLSDNKYISSGFVLSGGGVHRKPVMVNDGIFRITS